MIVEWFLTLAAGISDWVAGLLPTDDAPEWLATADDQLNGIMANLDGMGVWADWVYILIVVGAVLLLWSVGFVVKLARTLLSHVPQFGGSG